MTNYTDLTEDQASAARMADRGDAWEDADYLASDACDFYIARFGGFFRQAMHDRDRFHRERDYWREDAEAMRKNCGYAHSAPCWEALA